MDLKLTNSMTGEKETFEPLNPGEVRMYACGPTVYRYVHLGNLRTFLLSDLVIRVLEHNGYDVKYVMNITDVGHMSDELLEQGEDKILLAARDEGKTPAEIAEFYTEAFMEDVAKMNIRPADRYPQATDHVDDMISLAERLLEEELAYERDGYVYYDVSAFPEYGKLSGNTLTALLKGYHSHADPRKKNPPDFMLWRSAGERREMKWESPWGPGFPGWHVECSAMCMKHLGEQLDVHVGGIGLKFPHHENEIAQSEGVTGKKPFVGYWVHGEHLLAEGSKMAKSEGNYYLLADLEERGLDPLAYRLLCMNVHYRSPMNFTWDGLEGAQKALERMHRAVRRWHQESGGPAETLSSDAQAYREEFKAAINDDLGLPQAVATAWDVVSAELPSGEKLALILDFDQALGLDLADAAQPPELSPEESKLLKRRERARAKKDWRAADRLRDELARRGIAVEDLPEGTIWRRET